MSKKYEVRDEYGRRIGEIAEQPSLIDAFGPLAIPLLIIIAIVGIIVIPLIVIFYGLVFLWKVWPVTLVVLILALINYFYPNYTKHGEQIIKHKRKRLKSVAGYCPNCQEPIQIGSSFCLNCNYTLSELKDSKPNVIQEGKSRQSITDECPSCGGFTPKGTFFCPTCGSRI